MGKKINLFGKKPKESEGKIDKYPMMEYSAPRRLRATPMSENSAEKEGIKNAFPDTEEAVPEFNREGFHVKEQIGIAIMEYWMPKSIFDPNHVRTNMYTIGEVAVMILQGQLFRREFWPRNKFIEYREAVDLDENLKQIDATMDNPSFAKLEGFISMVTIHSHPIKKGKFEISIEQWIPSLDDIFSKDWQSFKIDLGNLDGKKKK